MLKKIVAVLFVVFVLMLIFQDVRVYSEGQVLVSKKETRLVSDWNAMSVYKPSNCTLNSGESVKVLAFSSISVGGSQPKQSVVQVSSLERTCIGWGFPDQFVKR